MIKDFISYQKVNICLYFADKEYSHLRRWKEEQQQEIDQKDEKCPNDVKSNLRKMYFDR